MDSIVDSPDLLSQESALDRYKKFSSSAAPAPVIKQQRQPSMEQRLESYGLPEPERLAERMASGTTPTDGSISSAISSHYDDATAENLVTKEIAKSYEAGDFDKAKGLSDIINQYRQEKARNPQTEGFFAKTAGDVAGMAPALKDVLVTQIGTEASIWGAEKAAEYALKKEAEKTGLKLAANAAINGGKGWVARKLATIAARHGAAAATGIGASPIAQGAMLIYDIASIGYDVAKYLRSGSAIASAIKAVPAAMTVAQQGKGQILSDLSASGIDLKAVPKDVIELGSMLYGGTQMIEQLNPVNKLAPLQIQSVVGRTIADWAKKNAKAIASSTIKEVAEEGIGQAVQDVVTNQAKVGAAKNEVMAGLYDSLDQALKDPKYDTLEGIDVFRNSIEAMKQAALPSALVTPAFHVPALIGSRGKVKAIQAAEQASGLDEPALKRYYDSAGKDGEKYIGDLHEYISEKNRVADEEAAARKAKMEEDAKAEAADDAQRIAEYEYRQDNYKDAVTNHRLSKEEIDIIVNDIAKNARDDNGNEIVDDQDGEVKKSAVEKIFGVKAEDIRQSDIARVLGVDKEYSEFDKNDIDDQLAEAAAKINMVMSDMAEKEFGATYGDLTDLTEAERNSLAKNMAKEFADEAGLDPKAVFSKWRDMSTPTPENMYKVTVEIKQRLKSQREAREQKLKEAADSHETNAAKSIRAIREKEFAVMKEHAEQVLPKGSFDPLTVTRPQLAKLLNNHNKQQLELAGAKKTEAELSAKFGKEDHEFIPVSVDDIKKMLVINGVKTDVKARAQAFYDDLIKSGTVVESDGKLYKPSAVPKEVIPTVIKHGGGKELDITQPLYYLDEKGRNVKVEPIGQVEKSRSGGARLARFKRADTGEEVVIMPQNAGKFQKEPFQIKSEEEKTPQKSSWVSADGKKVYVEVQRYPSKSGINAMSGQSVGDVSKDLYGKSAVEVYERNADGTRGKLVSSGNYDTYRVKDKEDLFANPEAKRTSPSMRKSRDIETSEAAIDEERFATEGSVDESEARAKETADRLILHYASIPNDELLFKDKEGVEYSAKLSQKQFKELHTYVKEELASGDADIKTLLKDFYKAVGLDVPPKSMLEKIASFNNEDINSDAINEAQQIVKKQEFYSKLQNELKKKVDSSLRSDFSEGDILYSKTSGAKMEFISDLVDVNGRRRVLVKTEDGAESSAFLDSLSAEPPSQIQINEKRLPRRDQVEGAGGKFSGVDSIKQLAQDAGGEHIVSKDAPELGSIKLGNTTIDFVYSDKAKFDQDGKRISGSITKAAPNRYTIEIDRQTGRTTTPPHELAHAAFDAIPKKHKDVIGTTLGIDLSNIRGEEQFVKMFETKESRLSLAQKLRDAAPSSKNAFVRFLNTIVDMSNRFLGTSFDRFGETGDWDAFTKKLVDFSIIKDMSTIPDIGTRYQIDETMPSSYGEFAKANIDNGNASRELKLFNTLFKKQLAGPNPIKSRYDYYLIEGKKKVAESISGGGSEVVSKVAKELESLPRVQSFSDDALRINRTKLGIGNAFTTLETVLNSFSPTLSSWWRQAHKDGQNRAASMEKFAINELGGADKDGIGKILAKEFKDEQKPTLHAFKTSDGRDIIKPLNINRSDYFLLMRSMLNDKMRAQLFNPKATRSRMIDPDNGQDIIIKSGITEQDAVKAAKKFFEDNKTLGQLNERLNNIFDEAFNRMAPIVKKLTGEDLVKEDFYMRMFALAPLKANQSTTSRINQFLENSSFLKERGSHNYGMVIRPFHDSITKAIDDSIHFIGMAEPLTELRNMLVHPSGKTLFTNDGTELPTQLGKLINEKFGNGTRQAILNRIANIEGSFDVNDPKMIRQLWRTANILKLAGPSTLLKQFGVLALMPIHFGWDTYFSGMINSPKVYQKIKSDFIDAVNSEHGAAVWSRMKSADTAFDEWRDMGGGSKIGKFNQAIAEKLLWGQRKLDKHTVRMYGETAVVWVRKNFPNLENTNRDEYLKKIADKTLDTINDLQPSGSRALRTGLHNAGFLGEMINNFRTSPNALFNTILRQYQDAKRSQNPREQYSKMLQIAGGAIVGQALYFAAIEQMLQRGKDYLGYSKGDDDDDDTSFWEGVLGAQSPNDIIKIRSNDQGKLKEDYFSKAIPNIIGQVPMTNVAEEYIRAASRAMLGLHKRISARPEISGLSIPLAEELDKFVNATYKLPSYFAEDSKITPEEGMKRFMYELIKLIAPSVKGWANLGASAASVKDTEYPFSLKNNQ